MMCALRFAVCFLASLVTTAALAALSTPPADFNRDGKPDILWSHTGSGATYVWHMSGPALVSDAFVAAIDPAWKVQGSADFNGDGKPDILWRNTASGNCYVWYMDDATFLGDAFVFALPPEWVIQGVEDFNADGKPDFLMRNNSSGVAFAWFFDNATPIGDQFLFGIDPAWIVEQVGDVNADAQPDLLFRNTASGLSFAWFTQYGAGSLSLGASTAPIFSIDPFWEIVQLGDWNNDGHRDLLFRNRDSGVVFVWYMTGTTLGASDFIIQIDPVWEIVPRPAAPDASLQIAAARAAPNGAGSYPIAGALVTYIKPLIGSGDPAGFFVQAAQQGPALFIAVDPATLPTAIAVGDRVSFTITQMGTTLGGLRQATSITSYTRNGTGNSIDGLVQFVITAPDLVTAVDSYESELIFVQGTITGPFASAGSGFVSADFDTTAIVGNPSLAIRIPTMVADGSDLAPGCFVGLQNVPLWRFGTEVQVSAWVALDFATIACPDPRVVSATALSPTSVRVDFDRYIQYTSVMSDGSQFTIAGLTVVAASNPTNKSVTLTTSTQAAGQSYQVTVASSVTDSHGSGVDPDYDTAMFSGYVTPAVFVLSEVNPNISGSRDLIELRAISAGTMNGITVVQNPPASSSSYLLMATLPNVMVAAGDIVMVHLNSNGFIQTETNAKNQWPQAFYPDAFDSAWDVLGGTTGLTFGYRVVAVLAPDGVTIQDAAGFVTTSGTPPAAYPAALQYIQSLTHWFPANSNGQPTDYTTSPTAQEISVNWSGAATTRAGNSVRRAPGTDTNAAADWSIGASSWGLAN